MTAAPRLPLVGIGLPTFNGERYLAEALESLLAQDYPNFRILIADNGSTDSTFAIASDFARRDMRVQVVRHTQTLSPADNFNFVLRRTSGPLFMWAADDDRWAPTYLSACVRALETAPDAVLACTAVRFIDEHGRTKELDPARHDNPDMTSRSVRTRIRTLLCRETWYLIYGLMRRDVLEQSRPLGDVYGGDVILEGELALRGPFTKVPAPLFEYRKVEAPAAGRGSWHPAVKSLQQAKLTPYSLILEQFARAVVLATVSNRVKAEALAGMVEAAYLRDTQLRAWLIHEARPRLRAGVSRGELLAVAWYAALNAVILAPRLARRIVARFRLGST